MFAAIIGAFFLQGGLGIMPQIGAPPAGQFYPYDINVVQNPYGIAATGFEKDVGRWNFTLEERHVSSLGVDFQQGLRMQRGSNDVEVTVRVHPFKQ